MRYFLILLLPCLVLADVSGIVVDNTGKRIPRARLLYTYGGENYTAADSNGVWRLPFASGVRRGHSVAARGSNANLRIHDEGGRLRVHIQGRKADGSWISPIESGAGNFPALAPRMEAVVGESLFVDMYGGRGGGHSGIAITNHDTSGVILTLNLSLDVCQNLDATDSLLDCRDGQKYALVEIANRKWTSRNLAYAAPLADEYGVDCPQAIQNPSPDKYPACGETLGFIYDPDPPIHHPGRSPRMICPDGSHVARGGDWDSLVAAMGGPKVADSVMRSEKYLHSRAKTWDAFVVDHYHNESGFGALNSPYKYNPSWLAYGVFEWDFATGWLIESNSDWVFGIDGYFAGESYGENAIAAVRCVLGK